MKTATRSRCPPLPFAHPAPATPTKSVVIDATFVDDSHPPAVAAFDRARHARTPSQDVVIGAGCHDNSHLPAVAISSLGAPCARIHPRNHCRWGCDDSLLPVLAASAPCTPHRHALTGRCQGGRLSQQHPFARGDRLCPLRASHRYAPTGRSDGAGLHALACIASNMNVVQHSPATALGQIAELLSAKLGTPTPPRDMAMGPD